MKIRTYALLSLLLTMMLALTACGGSAPTWTPTLTPSGTLPKPATAESGAAATLAASSLKATLTASANPYPPPQAAAPVVDTSTPAPSAVRPGDAYPPPQATPESVAVLPSSSPTQAPLPGIVSTSQNGDSQPYPAPPTSPSPGGGDAAVSPSPTPSATPPGVGPTSTPSVAPLQPTLIPTPTGVITPTPTEKPNQPLETPPPIAGTVSVWHAWNESERLALEAVVAAFQRTYPDVRFDLLYIPREALLTRFEAAAYAGGGPALLLGPAEWGPSLYDRGLVADLSPFATPQFLAALNPAALGAGRYRNALVGLPYAQRGVVLYRNKSIIPAASLAWDELLSASRAATSGGKVGAVFERSAFFSAAHLNGLGGYLMDANGNPTFNNASGLEWLNLLRAFEQAGPTTFNSDRDVQLFARGQAGYIIEGSWRRAELAQAIGADNLAIDPWPLFGNGSLSGFVQADNLFLNASVENGDRLAALRFIGYMLAPEVQTRLAEAGLIPSVRGVAVRDPLVQSALAAFERGTTYPIMLDSSKLAVYWTALDTAITDVFDRNTDAAAALQRAFDMISAHVP